MPLALLAIAALYLLLNIFLNIHLANGRISWFLAMRSVSLPLQRGINFAGWTKVTHGLTITNLSGFDGGNLLYVRKIPVTPVRSALLAGGKV
jgi:hypothetical protein